MMAGAYVADVCFPAGKKAAFYQRGELRNVVQTILTSWSGRRDSDSRPQPWQGCALPTELLPHTAHHLVRTKRLELLHRQVPDPKSGASAIPPRPHNCIR